MLFLVTGEWVEVGALLPPDQVAAVIERAVVPSLEMWAGWEDAGRVKGGIFAGERAGVLLLEAASSEEVGQMLSSLPFWGMIKWQVRPLQSVRSAVERERRVVERVRSASGG